MGSIWDIRSPSLPNSLCVIRSGLVVCCFVIQLLYLHAFKRLKNILRKTGALSATRRAISSLHFRSGAELERAGADHSLIKALCAPATRNYTSPERCFTTHVISSVYL